MSTPSSRLAGAVAAGVALGALTTLSPLMIAVTATTAVVVASARRGLPETERRIVTGILAAGLSVRGLLVLVIAWSSIPLASDQSGGRLFGGDELYAFERSLRTRDVLLGAPVTQLDYVMMFASYSDNKFMRLMSWIAVTFGPSPYALRALNGVLFVAAAVIMYRLARRGFGVVPALGGLVTLLFLPSLLVLSVSLLKDSVFSLLTAVALAGTIAAVRAHAIGARLAYAGVCAASIWALSDMRPDAYLLMTGAVLLGLLIYWSTSSRARLVAAAVVVLLACGATAASWSTSTGAGYQLWFMAVTHKGHVMTPGHSYRTLDDRFYEGAAISTWTPVEAARYVARAGLSFVAVPLPWHVETPSEFAYIPEQIAWYALFGLTLAGAYTAWRRDPLLASLLIGYLVLMGGALALMNGNVGTLIRLRGLVTRFLVWIAAVGFAVVVQRLMRNTAERAL